MVFPPYCQQRTKFRAPKTFLLAPRMKFNGTISRDFWSVSNSPNVEYTRKSMQCIFEDYFYCESKLKKKKTPLFVSCSDRSRTLPPSPRCFPVAYLAANWVGLATTMRDVGLASTRPSGWTRRPTARWRNWKEAKQAGRQAARSKGTIIVYRLSHSLTPRASEPEREGMECMRKSDFRFTCSIYNALRGSNI